MNYPQAIQNLINNFASLPGLGQKTAERLVFYLLETDKINLPQFADNLKHLKEQIKKCRVCGAYSLETICPICSDHKRQKEILCLVAEAHDIYYIENSHSFNGRYHVLNGLLSPADGVNIGDLNINSLIKRLEQGSIREIIMGFNPTVEGESTIIYLKKILKEKFPQLKITRFSRGLPMGGDLEYADEITLSSAIKNRNEI